MTILEAARSVGGDLVPPTMCYYSKTQRYGWVLQNLYCKSGITNPLKIHVVCQTVASCRTLGKDGMVVRNQTSPEIGSEGWYCRIFVDQPPIGLPRL